MTTDNRALAAHIESTLTSWRRSQPSPSTIYAQTQAWMREINGSQKSAAAFALATRFLEDATGVGVGATKTAKAYIDPNAAAEFVRRADTWADGLDNLLTKTNPRMIKQMLNAWRPIASLISGSPMHMRLSNAILGWMDEAAELARRKRFDDARANLREIMANVSTLIRQVDDLRQYNPARSAKAASEWAMVALAEAAWALRQVDAPTAKANGLAFPGAGDVAVKAGDFKVALRNLHTKLLQVIRNVKAGNRADFGWLETAISTIAQSPDAGAFNRSLGQIATMLGAANQANQSGKETRTVLTMLGLATRLLGRLM